ncbi:MAG: hypothetical protein AB7P04_13240 [Bacteriovoracia bacterium]
MDHAPFPRLNDGQGFGLLELMAFLAVSTTLGLAVLNFSTSGFQMRLGVTRGSEIHRDALLAAETLRKDVRRADTIRLVGARLELGVREFESDSGQTLTGEIIYEIQPAPCMNPGRRACVSLRRTRVLPNSEFTQTLANLQNLEWCVPSASSACIITSLEHALPTRLTSRKLEAAFHFSTISPPITLIVDLQNRINSNSQGLKSTTVVIGAN